MYHYLRSVMPIAIAVDKVAPGDAHPIPLDIVKAHCSVDGDDLDNLLNLYQEAAIVWAEDHMRRNIMSRTINYVISTFPQYSHANYSGGNYSSRSYSEITLPRGKCTGISGITYYSNGDQITLTGPSNGASPAGTDYLESLLSDQGAIITPLRQRTWPLVVDHDVPQPVTITYKAGWENINDVPAEIRHAILFAISDMLEMRSAQDFADLVRIAVVGRTFEARESLIGSHVLRRIF